MYGAVGRGSDGGRGGGAPFQNLASMSLLTASTTSADEYAPEVAFMTWPMILLAALSFFL